MPEKLPYRIRPDLDGDGHPLLRGTWWPSTFDGGPGASNAMLRMRGKLRPDRLSITLPRPDLVGP